MRVVVTGATGNIGAAVLRALADEPAVTSVLGLASRMPAPPMPKVEWAAADVATDELAPHLRGADAVVHLAWLFQPTHDPVLTWRNNVLGGIRLLRAAAEAGVGAVVHSSSVGAYSPATGDRPVDESWPTHGWPGAAYTREKAYLERVLDGLEPAHPGTRFVRIRPAFVFQRDAATAQRRLFAGPLLPRTLVRPGLVPVLPDPSGLRFQAVHADDLADAFRRALVRDVRGAFNVTAEPLVTTRDVARLLGARTVPVPSGLVRAAVAAAWRLHLVPASPDLFDAVLRLPVMSGARARTELGWTPRRTATDAVGDFLAGLRAGADADTPPLARGTGGPLRAHEFGTGIGATP